MNLWDMFKASKGIPVSDPMARLWGYQYQQKHGVSEISGVPPLHFTSRGEQLLDYRIYGNTVQDGTPSPEAPVDVVGCGERTGNLWDEDSTPLPYEPYGYKIPVTVSDGTNSITTPVYLGAEPLHKIGDYADYVDFKRGMVVRGIKKLVLTGEERVMRDSMTNTVNVQLTTLSATLQVVCTHFMSTSTIPAIAYRFGYAFIELDLQRLYFGTTLSTDDFKTYLTEQYSAGTPVTIWYVLAGPEEEPLENLLPIQTVKGTNILTADTTVQPSEMYIKGKIKPIGGNEND